MILQALSVACVCTLLTGITVHGVNTTTGVGTASYQTLSLLPLRKNQTEGLAYKVRPTYTRTELKVARSLNHDNTQKINVRSNNGRMVQIIVKKRNEKDMPHGSTRLQVKEKPAQKSAPVVTKTSGDYRFASDTSPESLNIINAFLKHVSKIERPARSFYDDDSNAENDRRPVRITVSSNPVEEVKIPPPVMIRSDAVYMKDGAQSQKRSRSLQEIGADGIPIVHGVRVPDDESDKRQVWRNARVINGELVPYEKGHVPVKLENTGDTYGQLIFAKSSDMERHRSIGPFTTADNFPASEGFKNFGPFSVEDNLRPAVTPGNRELSRTNGNIGPFSRADNSNSPNTKLFEYIKKINEQESKKQYVAGRTSNKEILAEQPKIQRRMLQNPGSPVYPVSQMYAVPVKEDSDLEDARKPVLQYAHPELGVQPAKPVPTEKKPTKATKKIINVDYYNKNVHNDHSPYAMEPAMANKDYYDYSQPPKVNRNPYEQFKNPATYPYNYGFIRRVKHERPFWMKISEQMRDSFQNGISTVQEFTKPVLEPIVEAGQKISKNLGFIKTPVEAQEKVGTVVAPAANSIILPALGLMAGGAALGLGAVAVGRFFDMSLLRRSGELLELDFTNMEHKRALNAIQQNPEKYFMIFQPTVATAGSEAAPMKRSKRSVTPFELPTSDSVEMLYPNDKFDDQGDVIEIVDLQEPIAEEEQHELQQRSRRAVELGTSLQDVEHDMALSTRARFEQQLRETNWKNPTCAKHTFCLVMIQQGADDIVLMEKKMYTMLEMIHPSLGTSLMTHLSEVTDAIRQHDCSRFICQQQA